MTHGDRIRSMTDEELVTFLLSREISPCPYCKGNGRKCWEGSSKEHKQVVLRDWLSSLVDPIPEPDQAEDKKN